MNSTTQFSTKLALIVALGGFLMGFDASVISGVVGFVKEDFQLTDWQVGWVVACLTLAATLAMAVSGIVSDRIGRKATLLATAALFAISAVLSAIAADYNQLVVARIIGGLGVGAALVVAPVYIAEISSKHLRGRLVSINQLNIVIGISIAFYSNYYIIDNALADKKFIEIFGYTFSTWRLMLAVEAIPAIIYFLALLTIPESPRWLFLNGQKITALDILQKTAGKEQASEVLQANEPEQKVAFFEGLKALFSNKLRLALIIAIVVGVVQQATGINAVFYYAPVIFEKTGLSADAAFFQATLIGLTNVIFTLLAIWLIDKLGRRPLLLYGLAGIVVSMFALSYGFGNAQYNVTQSTIEWGQKQGYPFDISALEKRVYSDKNQLASALIELSNNEDLSSELLNEMIESVSMQSIQVNQLLILIAILGFVACFAFSLGPIMWVLFSEIFPNAIRATAVAFVGFINSAVSFSVQFVFPVQLSVLGSAITFLLFGLVAAVGLIVLYRILPETKALSLEELEIKLSN